jgi:hypothetical protein
MMSNIQWCRTGVVLGVDVGVIVVVDVGDQRAVVGGGGDNTVWCWGWPGYRLLVTCDLYKFTNAPKCVPHFFHVPRRVYILLLFVTCFLVRY